MDLPTASLVGLILTLAGAGFYGYATYRNYKNQDERSQKTIDFQKQLIDKQAEIARLNQEIAETAKRSNALITGGDSFVWFLPAHDGHVLRFNLYAEGAYPMYDMQVIVEDTQAVMAMVEKVEKEKKELGQDALLLKHDPLKIEAEVRHHIPIGNVLQNTVMYGMGGVGWKIDGMDHRSFRIFTASRNGSLFEQVSVRRLADGTWVKALRARRVVEPDPITLKEMIDATFPKDDKGEPAW